MVKPELGTKRVCVSCGAKFYDLGKVPAVCPKCGTEQPPESPRPRRSGNVVDDRRAKKPAAVPSEDAAIEPGVEDEADAEDAEEAADLDDDEDDDPIGTEIEVEPDTGEGDR